MRGDFHGLQCSLFAKGKVERGIAYLRSNALKGRRFKSLSEQNCFLSQWETHVADKRIHGTTRKQVIALFEEERPHLQRLPGSLFLSYQEAMRNVHRDSYVEVARSFYEVPAEYVGHQVWVRIAARCAFSINGWNRSKSTPVSNQAVLVARWAQEAYMPR